jgi:hypothetical protein
LYNMQRRLMMKKQGKIVEMKMMTGIVGRRSGNCANVDMSI